MKKIIFSTMIASLLAFVGCQNEELVKESTDNSGKKVTLTAHIAGSADSRVTLEDKTEGGNTFINVCWEASGEQFTMYNANFSSYALFSQVNNNQFECDNFNLGMGLNMLIMVMLMTVLMATFLRKMVCLIRVMF